MMLELIMSESTETPKAETPKAETLDTAKITRATGAVRSGLKSGRPGRVK